MTAMEMFKALNGKRKKNKKSVRLQRLKDRINNLHTLDKYLIWVFTTAMVLMVYSCVCFWAKGDEPETTLDFAKWILGGEGGFAMIIKVYKLKSGKDDEDEIQ